MRYFYYPFFLFFCFSVFSIEAFGQSQTAPYPEKNHKKGNLLSNSFLNKSPQNSVFATANNECTGATTVTLGVPVVDNNIGATESFGANTCNFSTSNLSKDVWFSFTYATGMDTLKVIPDPSPVNDIVVELFSGTCPPPTGGLNLITCSDYADVNQNNQTEGMMLSALGLTVGTVYKFRVYGYDGVECNFRVIIKNAATLPPPANDGCTASLPLTAGQIRNGTSIGATQSLAPVNCSGISTSANDVWYSFSKTAVMDSLVLTPFSSENFVLEIRSNNCTTGNSVVCSNSAGNSGVEKISLSSLPNGTNYLVRAYGVDGAGGAFSIKIKSAPANNNCAGAITLNPALTCVSVLGSTVDATQSLPGVLCNTIPGNADDDVWYKFDMIAGLDTITVSPIGLFDAVIDLRSGSCASSTNVRCSDIGGANISEKVFVGDLTVGNTYFVRIYSKQTIQGTFNICLTQGNVDAPANDNCTAPIDINTAVVSNGDNNNATQTAPGFACGGPGSSIMNDVWYRFTKTAQIDTLVVNGLGSLDVLFDVRQNICPEGTVIACNDGLGSGEKKTDIGFLVDGTTYLLRVYGRDGTTGNFTIQFLDAISIVNPPANDECFDAIALTVSTTCTGTNATNAGSTESFPAGTCSGSNPGQANDVWFSFTANSTKAIARLVCNVGFDGAIQVYSGSCFGPTSLGCADAFLASIDPDFPSIEEVTLLNLIVGQQYYVRVYGKAAGTGSFSICVFNPNCNSTPSVLATNLTNILSNQAFTTQISSLTGSFQYETSTNQTIWNPIEEGSTAVDTLIGKSSVSNILYLRVKTRTNDCFPAFSNIVPVSIRCATPFANEPGPNRITRITFGSIDQTSSVNPLGGNVQDFSTLTTGLCRGNTYPLGITTGNGIDASNRMAWIDFNQDGDFADAGENVLNGAFITGATVTNNILIPATAALGSSRMRIAIIYNPTTISSNNPCETGPNDFGEIEEYTVNISAGLLANAGPNQSLCGTIATMAGNDPGAGATGLWTVVSGSGVFANPAAFGTIVSGLSAGPNVFKWTISNSCGSTNANVTITSSNVSANAGSDQSVCLATATLNAATPPNGNGVWSTLSGGASVTSPTVRNSAVTNLAIGENKFIWTVTSSIFGCLPVKDTISITRSSDQFSALAGPDQAFCGNSTSLAATPPAVGSGVWTVVTGNATFVNNTSPTTAVNGISNGSTTLRWTVSNGTCPTKSDDVILTVTSPPNANAGPDQNVCTTSVSLAGNQPGAGEIGVWTKISGTGNVLQPAQNNSSVSNLSVGTNQFVWRLTRTGCPQDADTVTILRKSDPSTATVGNNQTLCGPNATLSATPPTSGLGVWTLVSGSGNISNTSQPNSPVSNLGFGANTFRWTVSDSPCPSSFADLIITNNLPARPNAGTDKTECTPNISLTATNIPTGLSGTWSLISGSGAISNSGNGAATVNNLGFGLNKFAFSVTVPLCASNVSDTISITREANPVNLGKDTLVCQNLQPTYTLIAPINMVSYTWSNNLSTPQIVVSTNGSYWVSVVTQGGCTFRDTANVSFVICGSVEDMLTKNEDIKIIPNPSQGKSKLGFNLPNSHKVSIDIYNMNGALVEKLNAEQTGGESSEVTLPANLIPGIYLIRIEADSISTSLRWVVQK